MTRIATLLAVALALAVAGCGSSETDAKVGPRSDRLVDFSLQPPFVNALEIDPATEDFLLTTNRGFWRISPSGEKVTEIKGTITDKGQKDTVGTFLELEVQGDGKLIGSGHPDHQDTLPQFLGFISSEDNGKTWKSISRMGDADLHKIVTIHDKLYAWDAVLGAMLISEDGGKTFKENFTPRGLVIDFAVDPEDENYILAATEEELYRSEDLGAKWRPVTTAKRMRLSWPGPGALYRADQDGTVFTSSDKGSTWNPVSKVDGEPYKFKETDDPQHLYLALSDGTIVETTDGAKTWKVVFKP
jgi:photosystem II stability/assembly factor-like uncharacterized protein